MNLFDRFNVCKFEYLGLEVDLKGVFAKNKRGYRLTSENYRW